MTGLKAGKMYVGHLHAKACIEDNGGPHWEMAVTGPDGEPVPTGRPVVVDPATLCAAVQPLRAGEHAVAYGVTSADGDPVQGRFLFEVVTSGGRAVDMPEPCRGIRLPEPEQASPAVMPGWPIGLGVGLPAAAGAGGLAWWIALRRRRLA